MDPTATLSRALELARAIHRAIDEEKDRVRMPSGVVASYEAAAGDLADAVRALDGWIAGGGFLPGPWMRVSYAEKAS